MAPSPILFPPFLDFLNDQETLLAFLATIVLVLLTGIWLSWSPRKGGSDERTVILVGPSGAGKTSVFCQLTHSTHPPTTASLLPSTTHFLLPPPSYLAGQTYNKVGPPPRKLKIIDYPGHPRLAQGLKELIVNEIVKGGGSVSEGGKKGGVSVVFVVDGSGREKDVGGVVDLLLPLLPLTLPPHPLPLLLLTTKQDLLPSQTRSLSIPRLHTALTRELNARRASQSSSGKIELLEDDQIPGTSSSSSGGRKSVGAVLDEGVEEVLKGGGGGKWRWEDWKGVGWAGGWVGKAGEQGKKGSSAWRAGEEEKEGERGEGEKMKVKVKEEDGLGELKEWLWNLK